MAEQTEPYQHRPLQSERSIRVLELLPSKEFHESLQCRLIEISLDEEPPNRLPYEALSYVWSLHSPNRPIFCEGRPLLVTPNAEAALRRLRHVQGPRILWIDSICINQASIEERSQQVNMMGEVYTKAKRVIIWLGEGNERTVEGFKYLRKFAFLGKTVGFGAIRRVGFIEALILNWLNRRKEALGSSRMACIREVAENPWFSRIWTLQEVAFAENAFLVCGRETMSWSTFDTATLSKSGGSNGFLGLSTSKHWEVTGRLFICRWFESYRAKGSHDNERGFLDRLLNDTRQLKATLPEDHIYGMYQLLNAFNLDIPKPDYSKPVAQIFEEATLAAIRGDDSLVFFQYLRSTQRRPDLPSWVPDWSDGQAHVYQRDYFKGLYQATSGSKPILHTDRMKPGRICLSGKIIDKIKARGRAMTSPALQYLDPAEVSSEKFDFRGVEIEAVKCLREWTQMALQSDATKGRTTLMAELHRTLVGSPESSDQYLKRFCQWLVEILSPQEVQWIQNQKAGPFELDTTDERVESKILDNMLALQNSWSGACKETAKFHFTDLRVAQFNNAFFLTTGGRMGSGFHSLQVDDFVVLFSGAEMPMIMRPKGAYYQLIGPAYVNGVMQGQEWPKSLTAENLDRFVLV